MLKIDRPDDGDHGFRTARGNPTYGDGTLCYVDPKESEITTAQSAWIRGYLDDFEDRPLWAELRGPAERLRQVHRRRSRSSTTTC